MAIFVNGVLGSFRNRIGNIVTYRLKGQDVARSKAISVTNPRTVAQQSQRVKLANVVNMYKANRPWMERLAFENRPSTWSVYNAFVAANLTNSTVHLTKQQATSGSAIVAPYRVSEGSLAPIEHNERAAGFFETNLNIGADFDLSTATISQVTEELLANNNQLAEGMQLSLIVNYQQQVSGTYVVIVRYYEVILSLSDDTPFLSRMSDEHVANVNGSIGFQVTDGSIVGFTYVLSRDVAGRTLVSTQSLTVTPTTLLVQFSSDAQLNAALDSYGSSDTPFLAAGYQRSSNDNVELPLSIVSVNGVSAGGYLGTAAESASQLTVLLNQDVEQADVTGVNVYNSNGISYGDLSTSNLTVNGNTVVISTQSLGREPNNEVISSVVLRIGGTNYTISFTTRDPSDIIE